MACHPMAQMQITQEDLGLELNHRLGHMAHMGGTDGGGPPHSAATDDLVFLRGIVQTDAEGVAEFAAIVPGWYAGRTPHIHLKVSFTSDRHKMFVTQQTESVLLYVQSKASSNCNLHSCSVLRILLSHVHVYMLLPVTD